MNTPNLQRAFNEGSDARLAGLGTSANPYWSGECSSTWLDGWRHVNNTWGAGIQRRWPCQPLPPVTGGLLR